MNFFWIRIILLLPLLTGCGGFVYHKVEQGDTLSEIGKKYGKNYKNIAVWNSIDAPYALREGQVLRLTPPTYGLFSNAPPIAKTIAAEPQKPSVKTVVSQSKPKPKPHHIPSKPTPHITKNNKKPPASPKKHSKKITGWSWPTEGKVTRYFSFENEKKGIEISGRVGQSVRATAAGRVLYSGDGLDKYYKNLIVIEHDSGFLSTYGHNKRRLVQEGDYVAGGESVAEMGTSGSGGALLYFEIRKEGKPVNPLDYLSKK